MNTKDSEFQRIEREQATRGVPDAIHHTDLAETLEYITGWNDCRAAMLEQHPSTVENNGGKTGWPPGLLQDDCKGLSKWLSKQPDARRRVREALAEQPAQAQAPMANVWEMFAAYLIDKCEGEVITEEGLQRSLADMLADPKYTPPAQPAQVEVCCGDYGKCMKPCTPRGKWLAEQPAQQEPVGKAFLCDRCLAPFDRSDECPKCKHGSATKRQVYTTPQAQPKENT